MRYRFATLILFAMLPAMNVLSAPAPAPSAILDIGPPPKGETPENHRKKQIDNLTNPYGHLNGVGRATKTLPSVARFKDARPWLAKNVRVTEEKEGRRWLRLTFRAGTRSEQVAILNELLRAYLRDVKDEAIDFQEFCLRWDDKDLLKFEKLIESTQNQQEAVSAQKVVHWLRSTRIPGHRAEIARLEQITVIKWAR